MLEGASESEGEEEEEEEEDEESDEETKIQVPAYGFGEGLEDEWDSVYGDELIERAWDFVQEVIIADEKWTDPNFPPNFNSLFDVKLDKGDPSRFEKIEWIRASELFEDPKLFVGGIDPCDVTPGILNDLYFLSCLSNMAERKQYTIEHIFTSHEINKAGIYMLLFFVNGVRTPIIVDDYIPCIDGKPCFASSEDENEIWCILLEKAWAKLYGSYRRMEGGDTAFAASHLSGSPAWSVLTAPIKAGGKFEDFWSML